MLDFIYMVKTLIRYPNNIKKLRLKLGLSLQEFAQRVGVKNVITVKNWEDGKYLPRKGLSLILMLVVFNTTTENLYPNYIKQLRKEMRKRILKLRKKEDLPPTFHLG